VQVLRRDGHLRITARGSSMMPFIRDGDVVGVTTTESTEVGVGDVICYETPPGKLFFHRVIGLAGDGFVAKGDALAFTELVERAHVLGKVITVEREPVLAERAAATLKRMGIDNVEVAVADGSLGWPEAAPFNAIVVACAADSLPAPLLHQLADGGRLVIPIQTGNDRPQDLRLYTRADDEVTYRSLFPVLFVPLRTG